MIISFDLLVTYRFCPNMTAFIDLLVASSSLDIPHVDILGIDSAQCSYIEVLITKLAVDCS
jgi:hypothetical protein